MSDPAPALEALLDELTRRGSPLRELLRPGLPAGEVASTLSASLELDEVGVFKLDFKMTSGIEIQ